jgi:hypothetical protein
MQTSKKLAMAVAVATALVLPAVPAHAKAEAHNASRPTTVSRGDPFAACTVGAGENSVVYPGAEVEPSVTVSRDFPRHLVGAWQQDRWNDGGARGIVVGYTRDGGRTFHRVAWPVSRCARGGLNYDRASDPWVSTGPEGIVYGSAVSFDASSPRNAVVATTSYDGGRTWRNTTPVIADASGRFFNDKNSVTADPRRPGRAYQVWDRIDGGPQGDQLLTGATYMSVTRDFGHSWSKARVIVPTAPFEQTLGNVIVADPRRGTLYNFYTAFQFTDSTANNLVSVRYEVVRSTNGGRTWSAPSVIAPDNGVRTRNPNTGAPVRTEGGVSSQAIDPRTGELYMAYEGTDFTEGRRQQVQLVHSTNGGRTWSAPVRVNHDPAVAAFTPTVAVTSHGDVGVSYYDLRDVQPGNTTTFPTSTWLAFSPRGGTHFGLERRIAPDFDMNKAPEAGGFFIGDYQGLVASGDSFRALFVTTNSRNSQTDNGTDVRYGRFRSFVSDQERAAAAASPRSATAGSNSRQAGAPPLRPLRQRR